MTPSMTREWVWQRIEKYMTREWLLKRIKECMSQMHAIKQDDFREVVWVALNTRPKKWRDTPDFVKQIIIDVELAPTVKAFRGRKHYWSGPKRLDAMRAVVDGLLAAEVKP